MSEDVFRSPYEYLTYKPLKNPFYTGVDMATPEKDKTVVSSIKIEKVWMMKCPICLKHFTLGSNHFAICNPDVIETTARDIYPELPDGADDGGV